MCVNRLVMVVCLASVALLTSGCYIEQRADGSWWACDDVPTAFGTVQACQPIELPRLVPGR